jgi:hypothetical protein
MIYWVNIKSGRYKGYRGIVDDSTLKYKCIGKKTTIVITVRVESPGHNFPSIDLELSKLEKIRNPNEK